MKKFKCIVTRTDEYIIELDENILNEEWMQHFRDYFYDFDLLEEHAEHLAQYRARFGEGFIEGYGNVLVNGKKHWSVNDDQVNKAINIKIVSEDDDCDVDVFEM